MITLHLLLDHVASHPFSLWWPTRPTSLQGMHPHGTLQPSTSPPCCLKPQPTHVIPSHLCHRYFIPISSIFWKPYLSMSYHVYPICSFGLSLATWIGGLAPLKPRVPSFRAPKILISIFIIFWFHTTANLVVPWSLSWYHEVCHGTTKCTTVWLFITIFLICYGNSRIFCGIIMWISHQQSPSLTLISRLG